MSETRVALVTGSGKQRIGWYAAEALAARGFALAIHYRHSAAEAAATVEQYHRRGVDALALQADLTNESAARRLVDDVCGHFGQLDVLVNCAATWPRKPLEEITAADVRTAFDTNALSTFICSQQAGLVMVRQSQGGCIVNLGDWAIVRPYVNYAAYFASKGAIPTLTRCLAVELGTRNPRVRVNCIEPGPVMLPADLSPGERAEAIAGTLVQHEGRPENVAQAVLFFIDNDFVTGTCLAVDGGRTIFAP